MPDPVVYVGLGSSGINVLTKVKQAIELGAFSDQDMDTFFLGIDFADHPELPQGQYVKLSAPTRASMRIPHGVDPCLGLPEPEGAGRPAYASHAWIAVLNQESLLVRRIQNIGGRALPGRQEVRRYYLVTSLSDAVGVGLLLPVANLVRRVAATEDSRGLQGMKAILLVPPGLSEAKRAQVAAALREVRGAERAGWPTPSARELLLHPEEGSRHVFSSGCYVVEARHEGRPECAPQTLDELETFTAEWLTYMAVGAIQSGLRQDGLDEPGPPMGEDPTFSAFGLADYTVPTVAIADLCGRRLAKEMVESVLLAESGEAGLDEAAAFVATQGLSVATLKWDLPRAQAGMPLAQPLSVSPELQWRGPESLGRAWAFRERWERQDQPANILGLTESLQARLAALVAPLRADILRVMGRQPHGAFDRARAFLGELGRQILFLRADVADEQVDLETMASRLTSELAAEKDAALESAKTVGSVRRMLPASASAAAALLALAFIFSGLALMPFKGLAVAGAVGAGLAALNYLLRLFRLMRQLKGHLAKLREYLDCIRRSHIAESVGSLLSGFEGKVVEALGRLAEDRGELAMWFATMPLDPGGVLNETDRGTGHAYTGFRSRVSLATPELIERIYLRGTGIARVGPVGALGTLASDFLAPPQGLSLWLERSPGDRIQQLLEFCRGRFATQVYESAEDLLVSKVLEYGRLPSSETSSRMQRELAENLLTMMRPTSSCLLLADEPDQVIGLEEAGPTLVNRAIEDLHLQQGLLQVIPTGLPHRVVGMAFRHGFTLEDLAAWPEYEQALEDFSDPNLLHTRLVFSGQKSETAVPPPPSPPPLPPPMPPPEPPPPQPENEWQAVPEADGADRPPPVDLPSCFRLLGLEPGASDEEVEDAYFVLKARYDPEMGREKDVNLMAQVNRAYDEIVLSRRQAA